METRPSCPICDEGSPDIAVTVSYSDPELRGFLREFYSAEIDDDYLDGETATICYCPTCDFYWNRYVLGDAGMQALYGNWAVGTRQNHYAGKRVRRRLSELSRLSSYFDGDPEELSVLDYGMGWAGVALAAQAHGYDAYGYEIAPEKVAFAESSGVTVLDSTDELAEQSFDFVHLDQVLEHVPDPGDVVSLVSRVLTDDGLCFLSVPNVQWVEPVTKQSVLTETFQPLEHVNGFTPDSLSKIAHAHGLESVTLQRGLRPVVRPHNDVAWFEVADHEHSVTTAIAAALSESPIDVPWHRLVSENSLPGKITRYLLTSRTTTYFGKR